MAELSLRPLRETDLELLERFAVDPDAFGELAWHGFDDPAIRRRRWESDGLVSEDRTDLAVQLADGTLAGVVQAFRLDPRLPGLEIGCAIFPEHRRRGIGTQAQRLLVAELFATRPIHRIEAGTEVANIGERRALEAIGFREEGILRQADFRRGAWQDVVLYGLLRGEERT